LGSRGEIEAKVKSTTLANRGRIGADASSVKVLRPCLVTGNAGLAGQLAHLFASHKRRIRRRHCGSIIYARAFGRVFPVCLKGVQPIVCQLFLFK
jgi:hypothetical protein